MELIVRRMKGMDEEIRSLYQKAFTDAERIPEENMDRALARGAFLNAYYIEEDFIGFTFGFIDEDRMFFIYFATVQEVRGKGFGKDIIDSIRKEFPRKRIFLVTEPKDRSAEDYDMRVRRQNFYLRNGCEETGVKVLSDGEWFDTMFMQGTLTDQEMIDTIILYEDIHNGRA